MSGSIQILQQKRKGVWHYFHKIIFISKIDLKYLRKRVYGTNFFLKMYTWSFESAVRDNLVTCQGYHSKTYKDYLNSHN